MEGSRYDPQIATREVDPGTFWFKIIGMILGGGILVVWGAIGLLTGG